MWQNFKEPLLFLSLGINIAFVSVIGFFLFTDFHMEYEDHWKHDKHKQEMKTRHDRDPGWHFYTGKVGVSDTQWQNLRPDMEKFHGNAYEICKTIRTLRNGILKLIEDSESNSKLIQQKEEEIIDLKAKKQRMFVEYMNRKKQYLNRDQEKRFFEFLRKKKDCDKHARFLEDHERDRKYDDHR